MGLNPVDLSVRQTLRERVADTIRDAIIKGTLRPDRRIEETEMALKFNISRTPIREAIRQLEAEGFIKVLARKGAYVAPITEKKIREYYEIKSALEGCAAMLACSRISDEDIGKLEEINAKLEDAYNNGDWQMAFKLHSQFNDRIWKNCGNERLHQMLQTLTSQFQRFRIVITKNGKLEGSIQLNKEIINAFHERNTRIAEQLAKDNATYRSEALIAEILQQGQL